MIELDPTFLRHQFGVKETPLSVVHSSLDLEMTTDNNKMNPESSTRRTRLFGAIAW